MLHPNFLNKVFNYPTALIQPMKLVMNPRLNLINLKLTTLKIDETRIRQTVLDFQQVNQSSDNCVSDNLIIFFGW